jgi:hypothetical protein
MVSRVRRWVWAPLLAISMAMVAWGLRGGGFAAVKGWFDQLCAACIGLTGH